MCIWCFLLTILWYDKFSTIWVSENFNNKISIILLVYYSVHSPEMDSAQLLICSYVNWCKLYSSVRIENASSVSEVDWTSCKETLPKNTTVINSAFEELYWESKSCCSGNLTIKYRTGDVNSLRNETLFTVLTSAKL